MCKVKVKAVVSATLMLAVGVTVGAVGTEFFNSISAKKGLKREIELANEYANMMYVLSDIYYKQADCYDREDLAKIRRDTGDVIRNGANNVEELTRIAENIDNKIFVSEKDRNNIVNLEQTIENADFDYWKKTVEVEKKELEKLKTGVQ